MGVKDYFSKLFPESDEDEEDEILDEEEIEAPVKPVKEEKDMDKNEVRRSEPPKAETYSGSRATRGTSDSGSAVLELKVVRPEKFSSVGQIADHLLNRCTVVLNLEAADKDTARRIVDFLNGVSYSIDGEIKPVANNTFIITPHNVAISGEQLSEGSSSRARNSNPFDEF